MTAKLHTEILDGVAIVRFDNPPLGFLDGEMAVAFDAQLQGLVARKDLRVIVLTGATDGVFIRHFDLGELAQSADALAAGPPSTGAHWEESIFHRITRQIETCDVPVIAAINGDCMGVGLELALACDMRIARSGPYSIGWPEMNIAMFPGGGGTVRLARMLGPALAFELIATATVLEPLEAQRRGLVNHVASDPLGLALELAKTLAQRSRSGIAAAKRIIGASNDLSIEGALSLEQMEVNARLGSEEVRAALQTYVRTGTDLRQLAEPGEQKM
ncbi:MAG: enoyl-CoA hydratase/isomerase family protein [Parahaliea sp.]